MSKAETKNPLPDPKEVAATYAQVAQRASKLLTEHMQRQMKQGIAAPSDVPVHRQEIYEEIQKANREAASTRRPASGTLPKLSLPKPAAPTSA